MANLDSGNSNINIDGGISTFIDFGGSDTYTILGSLSGDVTITDTNSSTTINLPEGLDITSALFLADGVQFTVNGHTVTFLGDPASFAYVFGGTPLDPTAGTSRIYSDTAGAFGTVVPSIGDPAQAATKTGAIRSDGTIEADGTVIVDLSGQTAVAGAGGVEEIFVLEFDSSSGAALSSDAVVEITGFTVGEDILRFDDASITAQTASAFLNGAGGAVVAENGFAGTTTINFQDNNTADTIPAAVVVLIGVTDATLGGATPFFEIT
ncbi:MAG: hypothetical protein WA782_04125 [Sulfitobacter sp.]